VLENACCGVCSRKVRLKYAELNCKFWIQRSNFIDRLKDFDRYDFVRYALLMSV